MGSFSSIFCEINFGDSVETTYARILMLGLDNAGKSTILYQLKHGEVLSITPTIGFNVESIEYRNIKFTVWDLAGQDRIRKLWHHYYIHAKALIYVVDCNDVERLSLSCQELNKLLAEKELEGVPLLIFANKQDLPYAVCVKDIVEKLNTYQITARPWHIQACCASEGGGLIEGLDWLSNEIKARERKLPYL